MTDAELLQALESLRNTMISVATGGPRIENEDGKYQETYNLVDAELRFRGIANPLQYRSLWDWYGRWSSGDLGSYQSRRTFIRKVFAPLIATIRDGPASPFSPTGWERVDRTVGELRHRLASAANPEQYQAVGLLCREALISVAETAYVAERHPILDGVAPSPTDAKRRLEAFIAVELAGGANDQARKHARSALDLAVTLQHKRTASFREAALCAEATTSVINIAAIVSGRRDPA